MSIYMRACMTCARLDRSARGGSTCTAFPEGIPEAINQGRVTHVLAYPGDHGLQWAVADDAPERIKAANHPFPDRLTPA